MLELRVPSLLSGSGQDVCMCSTALGPAHVSSQREDRSLKPGRPNKFKVGYVGGARPARTSSSLDQQQLLEVVLVWSLKFSKFPTLLVHVKSVLLCGCLQKTTATVFFCCFGNEIPGPKKSGKTMATGNCFAYFVGPGSLFRLMFIPLYVCLWVYRCVHGQDSLFCSPPASTPTSWTHPACKSAFCRGLNNYQYYGPLCLVRLKLTPYRSPNMFLVPCIPHIPQDDIGKLFRPT